jgi:hypothetical protein
MLTCPMCKKKLRGVEKECPGCRTDVSLLRDYVQELRDGLVQAEAHTRAGQLGEAIWAYLAVLEVDPDNAAARRQVGQVATAVRQFDKEAPGRRFAKRLQKQTRFRRFMANLQDEGDVSGWISGLFWFILVVCALVFGFILGQMNTHKPAAAPDKTEQVDPKP